MVNITTQQTTPTPVAVVTVSYGSEDVLGPFLDTLPQASAGLLHVVVADNKPKAEHNVIADLSAKAGARYLPLASNRGYGHAINAAVEDLPSEIRWILISNPDVTLNVGSIDVLLQSVGEDESIGAIGPRILSSNGDVYPSARSVPSLRFGVGHALFSNLWPRNPWTRTYRRESAASLSRRDAGWLSGACLMVRRSAFSKLQGFDENYFMYFEDVDLGYRLGKLGLRNVYEPSAIVVHTGAHSTQENAAEMIRAHHESAIRFLSKKYSGWYLLPLRAALIVGLRLRGRIEGKNGP